MTPLVCTLPLVIFISITVKKYIKIINQTSIEL